MGALRIAAEIAQALEEKAPVVALESALITHGFAPPANLDIAQRMEAAVRAEGAIPATIAILAGKARIGLSEKELEQLAADRSARKVSLRDLPVLLAQGGNGGATVAATMHLAHRAGIRVFCTGGIGGVHRGHPEDASADLIALATTPIVTVCAGAKAILDLPRTLEVLETHGVPVIGYTTDEFPAFYSRRSGLGVDARVETPEQVAQIAQMRTTLGLSTALLVCVPVPEADHLPAEEAEAAIAQAIAEAEEKGIGGKAVTPFLLARMVELTSGRARQANEALLLNNARTAAHIARACCAHAWGLSNFKLTE
ncbi:MAG: pseudouridine-5'-phosphate glycosidase [Anaerolineae bacterium]|nr:pseudouridine-5'-phosphate glycosidase [Anaerolineae bacterium]